MERVSHQYKEPIYLKDFIYNCPQIDAWYNRTEIVGFYYFMFIV